MLLEGSVFRGQRLIIVCILWRKISLLSCLYLMLIISLLQEVVVMPYILDILKRVDMRNAKGISSPMTTSSLSKYDGEPTMDHKLYRSVIGALQYATITRPDIAYSVNKVSQYMHSPLDSHWKAVKLILRYLAGTLNFYLHLKTSSSLDIMANSDSDWASDHDDRKSTTGYCIFFRELFDCLECSQTAYGFSI